MPHAALCPTENPHLDHHAKPSEKSGSTIENSRKHQFKIDSTHTPRCGRVALAVLALTLPPRSARLCGNAALCSRGGPAGRIGAAAGPPPRAADRLVSALK